MRSADDVRLDLGLVLPVAVAVAEEASGFVNADALEADMNMDVDKATGTADEELE